MNATRSALLALLALLALALPGCTDDGPFGPGPLDPSATRAEPEFAPRLPNANTDADGKRFDPEWGRAANKKGPTDDRD